MAGVVLRKARCCHGYVKNMRTNKQWTSPTSFLVRLTNRSLSFQVPRNNLVSKSFPCTHDAKKTVTYPHMWNITPYSLFSHNTSNASTYHKFVNKDKSLTKEDRETLLYVVDNMLFENNERQQDDPSSDPSVDADALHYLACRLQNYHQMVGEEAIALAMPVFHKSAELGNTDAKYTYAQLLLRQNPGDAIEVLLELADGGHGKACYDLACAYWKGFGVQQSHEDGMKWYKKAAENGVTEGYNSLGKMYLHGEGCDVDNTKAFEFFSLAADAGDVNALMSLGYCYDQGVGTETDHVKMFECYQKAAEAGHPAGIHNVGVSYFAGKGVDNVDLTRAAEFYSRGADLGFSLSQMNLANMYYNGYGVEMDREKAKDLYRQCTDPRAAELLAEAERCEELERNPEMTSEGGDGAKKANQGSWWTRIKNRLSS